MALITDKTTRPQIADNNKKPKGVTRPDDYTKTDRRFRKTETSPESKYYTKRQQELRGYSDNVAKALQMMDMGFRDISVFEKTLSEKDKLVLENEKTLNDNIKDLWKELHSDDKKVQKSARELLNLKQKETWEEFGEQMKDLQMDAYEKSGMKQFFDKTESVLERNDASLRGVLGPLNLITKPFEEFFNFDLGAKLREKLFGGGKSSKRNPTENDVAKIGVAGAGYLYIANKIDKIFGKKKSGIDDDFDFDLGGTSGLSAIAKKILSPKGLATGGLIASLGATVYNAVQGYFCAEEWGVDKVSATIGGAFGGNGSGITNAFKQAGLGALGGASAGFLVGGPVGALIGGLGGLVLGAVGGYLGGEEVAKDVQNAKDVIFTDKTMKDVQKENLLADVDARVKSGELSPEVGDAYKELSEKMSTEDFAKLGKRAFESDSNAIADWIIDYGKGTFDGVTNQKALLNSVFNLEGQDPRSRDEVLKLYKWIGRTFGHDEGFISDIFKDSEHIYGFLESLNDLNMGNKQIPELYSSFLSSGALITSNNFRQEWKKQGLKPKGFSERKIAKAYEDGIDYRASLSNIDSVNDAILRPDGSIIKTNPKDTLVALKDIPLSLQNEKLEGMDSNQFTSKDLTSRLDILIKLLKNISTKEPVQLQMPEMGRQDLDLIMNGGII